MWNASGHFPVRSHYGPPSEPGRTASAFVAKSGKVTLLGSGTQQLAPLYRDDVVEAILHAALDPETPTGTFEFAGPDTMTAEASRAWSTPSRSGYAGHL